MTLHFGLDSSPTVTKERPDFGPTQVKSPEQIKPGHSYKTHYGTSSEEARTVKAIASPEGKWVKVESPSGSATGYIHGQMSLADVGVVPYDAGTWSQNNWLEMLDPQE